MTWLLNIQKAHIQPALIRKFRAYHNQSSLFRIQSSSSSSCRNNTYTWRRNAHCVNASIKAPTDYFTSTTPAAAQPTQRVEFDEEPCTLGLTDGYAYAHIDIGDRLGPGNQYEVLRKLGWGLYATTWLVKDHTTDDYLAMKIINQYGTLLEGGDFVDPTKPRFYEREILERISMSAVSPGTQYCIRLIDSFHANRDTGNHLCLVLELGGLDLQELRPIITTNHALPSQLVKMIVKQMCFALDYLHTECRVVHTDLKPSNLLLTFNPEDTKELIRLHLERTPLQKYPPRMIHGQRIEAIQSQPLPVPALEEVNPFTWVFRLTDFGSAQWIGRRGANVVQPIRLRAPEVVLGRAWNEKIDIWSLGCLTFELLTGKTLFRAQGGPTWEDEDDLLANHLELVSLTHFPAYFCQNSRYGSMHLKEDGSLRKIPERMMYPKTLASALAKHKESPINIDESQAERDLALSFIARCLVLDADERDSAKELLEHPWVRDFEVGKPQMVPEKLRFNEGTTIKRLT